VSSINRQNTVQTTTQSGLWQQFKQWFQDAPQPEANPQASSLNQNDQFKGSALSQSIANLSRFDHTQSNAVAASTRLNFSNQTADKAQTITAPNNWQALYLKENQPNNWQHQVQSVNISLQQLEKDGRLNQSLLEAIEQLQNLSLQPELNTKKELLIQSVLQDIATPESIMQGNKNTCAATVAQIKLAIEDPVKYVKIMAELAGPNGQSSSSLVSNNRSGDFLRLDPQAISADASGRSLSNRIFQTALMEYGNGNQNYHSQNDTNTSQGNQQTYSGLKDYENQELMNALFAGKYQTLSTKQGLAQNILAQRIENAVLAGVPISTGMKWGEGGHQVLVVGMDPKNVQLINPQSMGHLYHISRHDFEKHLLSAALPSIADPSLNQSQGLPGSIGTPEAYKPLPKAAYLDPFEFLNQKKEPLSSELKNSLLNAWRKTGLQTRHFASLNSILSQASQELKAPYQDTLADLSSSHHLNAIQAGKGILNLNQFVEILWDKKGTSGLVQANNFLQALRNSGLQTVWSKPEKAQQLLNAARASQLSPTLVQALKN